MTTANKTPTPRTDKVMIRQSRVADDYQRIVEFAQQLEAELSAANEKLARLRELMKAVVLGFDPFDTNETEQALRAELEKE